MIKNLLVNFKKTKIWYFVILLFIKPTYEFFWENIINFKGKLLYLKYRKSIKSKNNEYITKDEDKVIIRNSEEFKNLSILINDALNSNFLNEMRNKINLATVSKDHYLFYKPKFQINMFPFINDNLKMEIIKFALSKNIIDRVSNYFGLIPVLGKIGLNLNIPVKNSSERGSMLWHKDDFGYKTIDIFMPIKEITLENGPFHYVNKINKLGVFHKYTNIKKNSLRGERNKISIDDFQEKLTNDYTSVFTGKPGDAIFIDSFSCYHRGGFCKSEERILLRISYHSPDSVDMVEKKNLNGQFRLCDSILEDDQNLKELDKHILFYRPKVFHSLKIPQKLMNIYKFLHYKE